MGGADFAWNSRRSVREISAGAGDRREAPRSGRDLRLHRQPTSRALLNQMSYQYLMPYIDMGNRIAARDGRVTAGSGRVVVMTPLAPCLWCYEDIRAKVITEEALRPEERERLGREGYIEGMEVENPAVVSLN